MVIKNVDIKKVVENFLMAPTSADNSTYHNYILDSHKNLSYRFFTRLGGVSAPPFDSLNVSSNVGDRIENVRENRARIALYFGGAPCVFMHQVHSNSVAVVTDVPNQESTIENVDAVITQQRGVVLVVQHADCQPLLVYDPITESIGAIHNGWKGSCVNSINTCIHKMVEYFHVNPANLLALIGPSLCPQHSEFKNYLEELPTTFYPFKTDDCHFNFWEISKMQLRQAGVREENIQITGLCTYCDRNFFSYRREGITGRLAAAIQLRP